MCLSHRLAAHIDAWKRINALPNVLQWIKDGIKIPFACDTAPSPIYRSPHHHTTEETKFLRTEISDLQAIGAIEKVGYRPYCVSPIKCVPKKSGTSKYRLITDLRLLNDFVEAPAFQQESIHRLSHVVSANDELVTFDLKNGFFHIPVHRDYRSFLGFEFLGHYYVWCVLPFGLSCSPYTRLHSSAASF